MGGEVRVLGREEGFGELVMVGEVRRERLGAGEGSVWLRGGGDEGRLVVRLRLGGDVWLVQVELAHVNRVWRRFLTQERVECLRLRREGGVG